MVLIHWMESFKNLKKDVCLIDEAGEEQHLAAAYQETSSVFLKSPLLDYVDMIYENTPKLNLSRLGRVYKQMLRFALES